MLTHKPQAIAGVSATYENLIDEVYPSIGRTAIGQTLNTLYESLPAIGEVRLSYLLFVPFTWPFGLLAYAALKVFGTKYVVTTRAVKEVPVIGIRLVAEAPLTSIAQVSVDPDSRLAFFRSGDIRLTGSAGETLLLLRGTPYPERFCEVIREARDARQQVASSLETIRSRKA